MIHKPVNAADRASDLRGCSPFIGDLLETALSNVGQCAGDMTADITDRVDGQSPALCDDSVQKLLTSSRVSGHRLAQCQKSLGLKPQRQGRNALGVQQFQCCSHRASGDEGAAQWAGIPLRPADMGTRQPESVVGGFERLSRGLETRLSLVDDPPVRRNTGEFQGRVGVGGLQRQRLGRQVFGAG